MPEAIAYGGAFFFLVAALIVSWGMLTVYRLSLKRLLLGIAHLFNVRIGGFGFSLGRPLGAIADAITALAEDIDNKLAEAVIASEAGIVWLWHSLAKQAEWLGGLLGDLAETIEGKFRVWYLAFPPLSAIWAAVHAARELPALWAAIHAAKGSVVNVTEQVFKEGTRTSGATKAWVTRAIAAAIGATAGAVTAPLPWIRGRFGDVEGELSALRRRIGRLETPVIGAAALALVGAALSRLGLGSLRCPSVLKAAKRTCGMNPDLLDSLLADTLLIAGTVSLVEMAKQMETIMQDVTDLTTKFWRVT